VGRVVRQFRASFPQSRFLLIGAAASDEELVRTLFIGIQGYLEYGHDPTRLVSTLQSMARGHVWVSERALQQYVELSSRAIASQPDSQEGLTDRQRAVVDLVMRDLSNKEVAAALHISANTVKFHLSGIFHKLGVGDRRTLREVVNRKEDARASRLWLGLAESRCLAGTVDRNAGLRKGAAGLEGARRDGDML
jgi:DNA-binding NarL/FixJ family response regulator